MNFRSFLHFCMLSLLFVGLSYASLASPKPPLPPHKNKAVSPFEIYLQRLWPEAQKMGISHTFFTRTLTKLELDPTILPLTQSQAEVKKTIGEYLAKAVSDRRIMIGQGKARELQGLLDQLEQIYGVDRYTILGIWAMETNFGANSGHFSVIRSLATLAYSKYREEFFKRELIYALLILEQGHIASQDMKGSWAGAMGQTQFMPSSFMKYAVDFDRDGRKDIWNNVQDALASTARYLADHGWKRGEIWGYEVLLPTNLSDQEEGAERSFAQWADVGVRIANGLSMPTSGTARLLYPAGSQGPAFLITKNFFVIKTYNNSTSYALGVALLADRMAGGGPLVTPWP